MESKQYISLAGRRKQTIIIITVLFLITAALFTFSQPLRYGATSRLLVVQNYGPDTDAYNVSRSNQFLSNLLSQVVYSDAFYEKVMASGYSFDKNLFSADVNKRKKQWQDMVYTRAVADTGMIILKTYHQDKNTAALVNQAIAYTLMTKNAQFHGLGDNVKVKVIDNPALSDWPVKPNIFSNLLLGILAGLTASFYFIYLFPEKNLGFKFKKRRRQAAAPVEPAVSPDEAEEAEPVRGRPQFDFKEINQIEPAPAYGRFEDDDGEEIDAAGEADEFEPYFRGSINNLIQR